MSEVQEQVRARMVELRESAGLSQREVGRRLDMTGEGYRRKEVGIAGFTGADLARIARLYDMTLREAFPMYIPTEGEKMLIEDMGDAA